MRYYLGRILKDYTGNNQEGQHIATRKMILPSKGLIEDFAITFVDGIQKSKYSVLGLGYYDFEDREDFLKRKDEIVERKLKEVKYAT